MTIIICVFVPGPFAQAFDYLLPNNVATPTIGARVLVPLRNRSVVGIIAAITTESHMPPHKLKWVLEILDEHALFERDHLAFLQWIADYYQASMGDVCQLALPTLLRKGAQTPDKTMRAMRLTEYGKTCDSSILKRSKKQRVLLEHLRTLAFIPEHQIKSLGIDSTSINKLATLGILEFFSSDLTAPLPQLSKQHEAPLLLTPMQQEAVRRILSSQHIFQTFLLYGITGSGKTEIYLQVIDAIIKQGLQALVLVPEIGLTPQTVDRFVRRFGAGVIALHSGLTDTERMKAWIAAKEKNTSVVIGTRSALFAPFHNLGVIIIDEEHDSSFKQQDGIRYSARDAAVVLSNLLNIPIVLGSATPSFESWLNAERGRYSRITLPQRSAGAQLPHWNFIDLRNKQVNDGLSQPLLDAIAQHLAQNKQVLLFLNRRGFSPALICHQCGFSPHCPHCDTKMTYHAKPPKLACHHCGHRQKIQSSCKKCHYTMAPLGLGTQRIEQALITHFPDVPIIRIDRDSTARKNSFERMLDEVHKGHPQILLGTQMVAKGHHFPNVTMVGILNADSGLYSADFRATERIAQLILQVAGRSGRAEHRGEVYVQTYWPDHPLWQQIAHENAYELLTQDALKQRQLAVLPPFRFAAMIRAEAKQASWAEDFLSDAARRAKAITTHHVSVLGPIPALQAKRAGYYRSQLLLISKQRSDLQTLLKNWLPDVAAHCKNNRIRWHVDVDPLEFD